MIRWGKLETESFEGMRLGRIAFMRRGIRSCKELNLLGRSGCFAFEGDRGVVKFYVGCRQVGVDVFLQDNELSTTAGIPTAQAHVRHIIRLSGRGGEITYAYRVQV